MGLSEVPEIKFAQKLFKLHKLKIPFDLEKLVTEYAEVLYKEIPINGVDGVSLNLKVPGKKPTIIVNNSISPKRQVFTLAHELGHIIIPWHLGTIVDEIYSQSYKDFQYFLLEQEANKFAAELLMPRDWVLSSYEDFAGKLDSLQSEIIKQCNVSGQAAAIRMTDLLPNDIVYCAVDNNYIIHSGKTTNTNAFVQKVNSHFDKNFYPYIENKYCYKYGSTSYHWWKLSSNIQIEIDDDPRTWKTILDDIVADIQPNKNPREYKNSINGIVAHANGKIKRTGNYTLESVLAAVIYNLRRENLENFVEHKDFEKFAYKKVYSMINK